MKGEYQKIKGLGTGRGSFQLAMRSRLYETGDHLLLVQSTGYTEEYKRVFYRDVRYVVARKDRGQIIHGIVSAAIFIGIWSLDLAGLPFWVVICLSLPIAIWFMVNLIRGATCRTYISTDVQTLEVPTPRRMDKVPILIAFLNTKIAPGAPTA